MSRVAAVVFLLASPLAAVPVGAQDTDARVLRPGIVGVSVGGEDVRADALFTGGGGTQGLTGPFSAPLSPAAFAPLARLAQGLDAFLGTTGGAPFDPADLSAGRLEMDVVASTRTIPVRVAVGVAPRLELGIRLPVQRSERLTRRFVLAEGNVGVNPDPVGNASLLAGVPAGGVGGSPLLPVAGTPLAGRLQARVVAATGGELELPVAGITTAQLAALGLGPLPRAVTFWEPGDLELSARFEALRSFDSSAYPAGEGVDYRLTISGSARLPTGTRATTFEGPEWMPEVGRGGFGGGALADLFVNERFWSSGGVSFAGLLGESPSAAPGGSPAEGAGALARGSTLQLWVTPRFRLTREISFGATMRAERWNRIAGEETPAGVESAGSRDWAGFSLRYTALRALAEGRSRLPFEFTVGGAGAIRGSAGVPAERFAYLRLSLEPAVWGRRD